MTRVRSLHIIGSGTMGGAEQFFLRLVTALHERGESVGVVIRPKHPLNQLLPPAVPKFHAAMANGWDLRSVIQIRSVAKSFEAGVVQTYMGRATRLTRLRNRPPKHIARLGSYYKLDGYFRHADAWVGITKGISDYLVEGGMPRDRVFHIANFVDPAPRVDAHGRAAARERLGLPVDARVVFTLGRFVRKKGFLDFIDACSMLRDRMPDEPLQFVIAGDGSERAALEARIVERNLEGVCTFPGWLNDASEYFAAADVLVCPSLDEPHGNVILEGWANHLPLISTATAGPASLIEDGTSGLLTPIGEPAPMAAAIERALTDSALAVKMVEHGRDALDSRFGRDKIVNDYLALYETASTWSK